jgi:polyisoprenoid-binding protein YceI
MTNRYFMIAAACAGVAWGADTSTPLNVRVEGGMVRFDSGTNLSAVSVHGKATTLHAVVHAQRRPDGLFLDEIQASLPVKAISTGMGLRDEHMRKYIFTTPNGAQPDLQFTAASLQCPVQPAHETACQISGQLSIRDVTKPFAMTLKIRQDAASPAIFKAAGEATIKLSDYGIERPSQLGVQSQDEVKLALEFTGKETATSARAGGVQ